MNSEKKIIEKWYKRLGFPPEYDREFYELLEHTDIDPTQTADSYNLGEHDGGEALLMQLYFVEVVRKEYIAHHIPDEIFYDTMHDIVRWTKIWYSLAGRLCLLELPWLRLHLTFKLFKLGRLQFCMQEFDKDYPDFGISVGDTFLDVHIPAEGVLDAVECEKSFRSAGKFFAEYFPDFKYKYFSCFSWLLDNTLTKYVKPDSNIMRFQRLFTPIDRIAADDILRFTFSRAATRENLDGYEAKNAFQQRIKDAISAGEIFYETKGIIDRARYENR